MSPGAIVLRIIILVVAFCLLVALLAFALKLVFLVASLVGIVLCGIAAFFIFRKLFFNSKTEKEDMPIRETKLWSQEGSVQIYKQEPKVHQLVDKSSAAAPAKMLTVPADAEVSVLQESDIAIRIKIKTGAHKGHIGWVDKANVIGYSQKG
jgi:hypothetical protein